MNAWLRVVLLAMLIAATGWLAVRHLEIDHRIDRFLPTPASPQQALVADQVGSGPGSRLILAGLEGAETSTLATLSHQLVERWREIDGVAQVENGSDFDLDRLEPLFVARFLLVDGIADRLEPESVSDSLNERRADLALAGRQVESLIRRDPLGLLPELAESATGGRAPARFDGAWFDAGGQRALLLVRTSLPPFDIAGQQQLLDELRGQAEEALTEHAVDLKLAGTPVIAVDSARQSRRDAVRLSALAGGFLLLVLLLAWRSVLLVAAGSLPLLAGVVSGLLVTALAFGQVHALTLAFGFTLLGVAMDYPLHLFGHSREHSMRSAARTIRTPLLLGALSTLIAYLAVWQSASPGLSQLGAFSSAGLAAAAAVTLLVLPHLKLDVPGKPHPMPRILPRLPWLPGLLALVAAGVLWWPGQPGISDELTRLTPVDPQLVADDAALRQSLGADDLGWLLVVREPELEATLQAVESAVTDLESAAGQGLIEGWQAVTELVPSRARQQQRRQQWPGPGHMRELLTQGNSEFRADAFDPFLADLAALDSLEPIEPGFWQSTPLAARVESLLTQREDGWRALILTAGVDDPAALDQWLREHGSPAQLVNLRETSESMVADYRREVGLSLAIAAMLIMALLGFRLGGIRPMAEVILPVAAAILCTAAVMARLDQGLSIVHLIGLLLAGGVGLDFALFGRRLSNTRLQAGLTRRTLAFCTLSSGGVFLILGLSEIGLLRMLGQTVAIGILLSLLFAWMSQPREPDH